METITQEIREEAHRNASSKIQKLYCGETNGHVMYDVYRKYLNNGKYIIYGTLIGDTILGFHKTNDLPRLFQTDLQINADMAQRILSDLAEFLSPVLERETAQTQQQKEGRVNLATNIEHAHKERVPADPVQTHDIEPMHTMESDGNRVHGYGAYREKHRYGEEPDKIVQSSQDDILKQDT